MARQDEQRRRRRDPFIALNTDDFRHDTQRLLSEPAWRDLSLRGALHEFSMAIVDDGEPLPRDERIAARKVRMDPRTYRAVLKALTSHGCVHEVIDGWMTDGAQRELLRRNARVTVSKTGPRRSRSA